MRVRSERHARAATATAAALALVLLAAPLPVGSPAGVAAPTPALADEAPPEMTLDWVAEDGATQVGDPFHSDGTFLYVRRSGIPTRIVKIRLVDMAVVDAVTLEEDGRLTTAVVDGPYALLATGQGAVEPRPGRIVGVRLADLVRVGHYELDTPGSSFFGAGLAVDGYGYFATGGRLVKVRSSDLALVGMLEAPPGESFAASGAAVTDGTHGYFASLWGDVVKVHLQELAWVRSRSLGPAVAGLRSRAAVTDGTSGYFAFAWPLGRREGPSRVVGVRLSDLEVMDIVTLGDKEDELGGAVIDGRYVYVGTGPGAVVRLSMHPLRRVDAELLGSGRYGIRSLVHTGDTLFIGGRGFLARVATPVPVAELNLGAEPLAEEPAQAARVLIAGESRDGIWLAGAVLLVATPLLVLVIRRPTGRARR